MAQQEPARSSTLNGDPWQAFAYLVSGVAFYGLLGWLADRWLGTSFLVAVGILLGAVLGIYMTWRRFSVAPETTARAEHENVDVKEQEKQ
jgi:F0F1-type ATP synthase assembly protein I